MRIEVTDEQRGLFAIRWLRIHYPALPREFHSYRAVQLTDLHLGPATSLEHLEEGFRIVERLCPQVVFLTGDYVQNTRVGLTHALSTRLNPKVFGWMSYRRVVRTLAQDLSSLLARVKPDDGIFAVAGNHDYLEGIGSIRRMFSPHVKWLFNQGATISRGDFQLGVFGVDDYQRGRPNLTRTLEGLKEKKTSFNILLSHNPDIVLADDAGLLEQIQLVLCGHTHGGQICLPWWGPMATRTKQKTHVRGLSRLNDTHFHVNCGLGYGLIGVRILCPPEITVIELCADN